MFSLAKKQNDNVLIEGFQEIASEGGANVFPPIYLSKPPNMKTRSLLLVSAFALSLSSCKEDPTTVELLTANDWRMTSLTIDPPVMVEQVLITNFYSQIYEYDKDNILRFLENGTFVTDEGATKEFPSDPQTRQGDWQLSVSEDELTVSMNGDTVVYGLIDLDEEAMTLNYSERDTATDINYTLTAGFEHN